MNKKVKLFYGYHFPMTTYWGNYRKGGFTQLSLGFSSRCNYKCDWCFNKRLLNKDESDILSLSTSQRGQSSLRGLSSLTR